jgi:hypothetical protein
MDSPGQHLADDSAGRGSEALSQVGSFDFLGFTHFWSQSKKAFWVVKRKTAGSRFQRALTKVAAWCRLNRHLPMGEQHQALGQKLRGHFAYYGGVMGNLSWLKLFRTSPVSATGCRGRKPTLQPAKA